MADSRFQELQRTWVSSGTVEDEAAYLRERFRTKDLSETRLRMAAEFGYLPARMAYPVEIDPLERVDQLLRRFKKEGRGTDRERAIVVLFHALRHEAEGFWRSEQAIGHEALEFAGRVGPTVRRPEDAKEAERLAAEVDRMRGGTAAAFHALRGLLHGMIPIRRYRWTPFYSLQTLCRTSPEAVRDHGAPALGRYLILAEPRP